MQRVLHNMQPMTALPHARRHPLVPPVWEIAAMASIAAGLASAGVLVGEAAYPVLNVCGPFAILAVLAVGAFKLGWGRGNAIWTSLFWFRVSTATYFGFGSMVPDLVNEASRLHIDALYRPLPEEHHKLNVIVALSVTLVLLTARTVLQLWPPRSEPRSDPEQSTRLFLLAAVFAVIGYSVRFFVIIPVTIGIYQDTTLPGAVMTLGVLAPVSLYMLTVYAVQHRKAMLPVVFALLASDILVGIVLFNKSHAVVSVLMFTLGWLSKNVTLTRLAATALAVLGIFYTLPPITDFGRIEISRRYGPLAAVSLSERLEIILDYSRLVEVDPFEENVQSAIVRFSYVNAATRAISWHDGGEPGNSLDNIFYVFIPRLIWPDKPEITRIGIEFSIKAMGNPNTSTAPGIFPDVYWALGWPGVPLLMIPVGIIFSLTSKYALWVLDNSLWQFFPAVLYCMIMGLRMDGFYVVDVAGPLPFVLALHGVGKVTELGLNVLLRRKAF